MIPIISTFSDLASKVIDVWRTLKESKDKRLDREHQRKLQEAQHEHERLLAKLREHQLHEETERRVLESEFVDRLGVEAQALSDMGFEVIFEPIGDGYGLALPMSDLKTTFVFWLPLQYPTIPPKVLVRTSNLIEQIEFASGAWEPDHTLAEVVSALITLDQTATFPQSI